MKLIFTTLLFAFLFAAAFVLGPFYSAGQIYTSVFAGDKNWENYVDEEAVKASLIKGNSEELNKHVDAVTDNEAVKDITGALVSPLFEAFAKDDVSTEGLKGMMGKSEGAAQEDIISSITYLLQNGTYRIEGLDAVTLKYPNSETEFTFNREGLTWTLVGISQG
ncbi:DUF2939 domain-containing protein [Neptuniibacter sp. QD37_11]|uniref:DUF2939 domain-containing protein n=1 Tax=Neptuniibacter sp. QD37_11 TaxID=3398209 RepID=UPI0039F47694